MNERKWNFEEKKIFRQNCFGASTFSAFSKGQKSTSKFWKTPEAKKMRNKTYKCSKLLLFFKKIQVNMVKNVKNCSKSLIMWKLHICSSFLRFSQCYLNFFWKMYKSLEHLYVLLRIFFVSGVFKNFDVDFLPLLKAKKVLAPKQFWRKIFFSSKFHFLSSIWIYKLSASRTPCI